MPRRAWASSIASTDARARTFGGCGHVHMGGAILSSALLARAFVSFLFHFCFIFVSFLCICSVNTCLLKCAPRSKSRGRSTWVEVDRKFVIACLVGCSSGRTRVPVPALDVGLVFRPRVRPGAARLKWGVRCFPESFLPPQRVVSWGRRHGPGQHRPEGHH